jgi:hypothetical protein
MKWDEDGWVIACLSVPFAFSFFDEADRLSFSNFCASFATKQQQAAGRSQRALPDCPLLQLKSKQLIEHA